MACRGLTRVSLMTSDVSALSYLLATYMSLGKCLFWSFAYCENNFWFAVDLYGFLMYFLLTLSSHIWFSGVFSHFIDCLFILLTAALAAETLLSLT